MTFNSKQLAAIAKLGMAMAAADGVIAEEEKAVLTLELMKFGLKQLEAVGVIAVAQKMSPDEAHDEIKVMSLDQKKYVTGYLAAVMASDGDIADVEVKVWSLMSALCNLPTMTVGEALEFWNTH